MKRTAKQIRSGAYLPVLPTAFCPLLDGSPIPIMGDFVALQYRILNFLIVTAIYCNENLGKESNEKRSKTDSIWSLLDCPPDSFSIAGRVALSNNSEFRRMQTQVCVFAVSNLYCFDLYQQYNEKASDKKLQIITVG